MISQQLLKQILDKVDIVDVISEYIPLSRKGKNFVGKCPFHDDHDPSMMVSREKQIFKCFVCGEGGNAIKFISAYEEIPFKDAVQRLAEKAGIKINESISMNKKMPLDPASERMLKLLTEVNNYVNYMIRSEVGTLAKEYIQKRLGNEAVNNFSLGYANSSEELIQFLNKKGFTNDEMRSCGIINNYDKSFLAERLIIPIQNNKGQVVGFGSRKLGNGDGSKYVNSPESFLFRKGNLLFNQKEAMQQIRQKREVIVVEGYMDVFKCRSVGIDNVVATMGTAMTNEQCRLLKDMNTSVKLCYDGDTAGIRAAIKNYSILKASGVQDVHLVHLPDGCDPDELIEKDLNMFKALLDVNENIMDFYLKTWREDKNFAEISKYTIDGLKLLKSMDNVLAEDFYLNKLSDITKMKKETLERQLSILSGKENNQKVIAYAKQASKVKGNMANKNQKYIKVNFSISAKVNSRYQIKSNFDRLNGTDKLLAFDEVTTLDRQDVLKKYLYQKGPVLSTRITLVNYKEIDCHAQMIADEAIKSISESLNIAKSNIDYIGFLHKDTKNPHLHLDVYQKEPYLSNFSISNALVTKIETSIKNAMDDVVNVETSEVIEPGEINPGFFNMS